MSIYAVGDIQGCYDPLAKLLETVNFDPSVDTLWCVGDLVNRGPKSLKVLRLLKSLEDSCVTVLGNHDIHLLSMVYGIREPKPSDSLDKILRAPDLPALANWLRSRPLMVQNKANRTILVHAGIYPWWTRKEAKQYAKEVQQIFADEQACVSLLKKIYSNAPSKWDPALGKTRRHRFIINAFTRMRFCSPRGHLNLSESGYYGLRRKDRIPWFEFFNPGLDDYRVIFGHWSALGFLNEPKALCLDTGYVWGRKMTMVRLPDKVELPANTKKIKKRNIIRVDQDLPTLEPNIK